MAPGSGTLRFGISSANQLFKGARPDEFSSSDCQHRVGDHVYDKLQKHHCFVHKVNSAHLALFFPQGEVKFVKGVTFGEVEPAHKSDDVETDSQEPKGSAATGSGTGDDARSLYGKTSAVDANVAAGAVIQQTGATGSGTGSSASGAARPTPLQPAKAGVPPPQLPAPPQPDARDGVDDDEAGNQTTEDVVERIFRKCLTS